MSKNKEFKASELSEEQLAGINGGFGGTIRLTRIYSTPTTYQGNPEDLVGKTIRFEFYLSMPMSSFDTQIAGEATVTGVGNLGNAPWIPSDVPCVTTNAGSFAQVVPLFGIKSYC